MKDLAELVIQMMGSTSKLIHRELPHDDPKQRAPGKSVARERLDWAPSISLEEGLEKTISYLAEVLSVGNMTPH